MKKDQKEQSYQALYEELERRYGPFAAQEIVDQVKKADEANKGTPSYMGVKAVSEALELFRLEIRNTIGRLKVTRHEKSHWPDGVADLEEKRLEHDLQRLLPVYWVVMQSYYRLYTQAMEAAPEIPDYGYTKKLRKQPEATEQMAA